MPSLSKDKKTIGFTLLELLLAMFIFTIVSMIISGALHAVITTQSATETHAKRLADLQMAFIMLSRDFEQAINRPITTANGSIENTFVGTHNSVNFTHTGADNPTGKMQRSHLQRTHYRLTENVLMRDTWPQLDLTPQSQKQKRPLLKEVDSVGFEYFDQKGHRFDRWPPPAEQGNMGSQPRAVKIWMTLKDLGKISQLYVIPGETLEKEKSQ